MYGKNTAPVWKNITCDTIEPNDKIEFIDQETSNCVETSNEKFLDTNIDCKGFVNFFNRYHRSVRPSRKIVKIN